MPQSISLLTWSEWVLSSISFFLYFTSSPVRHRVKHVSPVSIILNSVWEYPDQATPFLRCIIALKHPRKGQTSRPCHHPIALFHQPFLAETISLKHPQGSLPDVAILDVLSSVGSLRGIFPSHLHLLIILKMLVAGLEPRTWGLRVRECYRYCNAPPREIDTHIGFIKVRLNITLSPPSFIIRFYIFYSFFMFLFVLLTFCVEIVHF